MIKNIFNNYFFILFGALIFGIFIWLRFIRERFPKEIPFNLSLLGFIILIYICIIYVYIIISLVKSSEKANSFLKEIINILYKPLEEFDYFWKHLVFVQKRYQKFGIWLSYKLRYIIISTNIFYIIFAILPRIILILVFSIDIFYFHKLEYIYKFLFLGIFLFLNRYIIYSLKMLKKDLIIALKVNVITVTTDYEFGIHPSEWPENYDPEDPDNDEIPPTMALPVEIFIDYYIKNLIYYNKNIIIYITGYHKDFIIKIFDEFNLDKTSNIPLQISTLYRERTHKQLQPILDIAETIEYYNLTNTNNTTFKYIKILIFVSYLICWLNILFVSVSMNNWAELFEMFKYILINIEEPFSGFLFLKDGNLGS